MIKKVFLLAMLSVFLQNNLDSQTVVSGDGGPESLNFMVHFRFAKTNIDTTFLDNAQQFRSMLRNIMRAKEVYGIDSITILTTSSPEGNADFNRKLIVGRANSIRDYIVDNLPQLPQNVLYIKSEAMLWDAVREKVEADTGVPMRSEVLKILDSGAGESTKEARLKGLGTNSDVFNYIAVNMLRYMRKAVVVINCPELAKEEAEHEQPPTPAPEPEPTPPVAQEQPAPVPQPAQSTVTEEKCRSCLRIKTNAPLLLMTVLNLGAEICFNDKISLDFPLIYNPFVVSRQYKVKGVAVQPELRYWLGNSTHGHFFGLHGGVGWYNLAINSDYRYQDKGGNTPMWNFGVSYGYLFSLTKRLGLELTIGAGYNHTTYDMFFNIPNGALYDTRKLDSFGITRAGINLTYNIW